VVKNLLRREKIPQRLNKLRKKALLRQGTEGPGLKRLVFAEFSQG
jgi:hypothetical protein